MKSLTRLLLIALVCFVAAACQKAPPPAPAVPPLPVPGADATNDQWKKYVAEKASRWLKEQKKSGHIWATFLPKDGDAAELLKTTQDNFDRGILSGTILVFGSPDSTKMADFLQQAFANVRETSLKGVVVIFIGNAADKDRVQQAVATSGVDYVFLEAK
jgi:hypothetical protein